MIDDGYLIIIERRHRNEVQYEIEATEKGQRFGVASANPAIIRQKADQLLQEVIVHASRINDCDDYAFYVEQLCVFGSYLSDKEVLNDLDVFYKLKRKYEGEAGAEKNNQRIETALKAGREFSNFLEQMYWPEREVQLALKTKKKGLSLHDANSDDVFAKTPHKIVFECTGFGNEEQLIYKSASYKKDAGF